LQQCFGRVTWVKLLSLEVEEGAREEGKADMLPEKLEQIFSEILTQWI